MEEIKFELSYCDKWILSRYNTTIAKINEYLDGYKVTEYSKLVYDFIWRDFCDWYVEILKVQLNNSADLEYKKRLIRFSSGLYENIMKILHPIMPFITEEIYHLIDERTSEDSISTTSFPTADNNKINVEIETQFELIQNVVEEVRKLRASINIPSQKLPAIISVNNETILAIFNNVKDILMSFCKFSELNIGVNVAKPDGCTSTVYRGIEIHLIIAENIDIDKESQRLEKEIARLEGNIRGCESKLNNEKFMSGASPEIISREKEKLASMQASLQKVKENLLKLRQLKIPNKATRTWFNVTTDKLISDMKDTATKLNKNSITATEYNEYGTYTTSTCMNRFGSWNKSLKSAGLKINKDRYAEADELFRNLIDVYKYFGRRPFSKEIKKPLSKCSLNTYIYRFGSWKNTLKKFVEYANSNNEINKELIEAGLDISTICIKKPEKLNTDTTKFNIATDQLLENLIDVRVRLGKLPVAREMKKPLSKYSTSVYISRFGSWEKTLKALENYINNNVSNVK